MMNRIRNGMLALVLGLGFTMFQGCPVGGLVTDCFGEDSISQAEYEDLTGLEQMLYDENDCGRYEPRSGLIGDLL